MATQLEHPDAIAENIARDRDQLWAEAAYNEAEGECITLPKSLWAAAAEGQAERLIVDPWQERLSEVLSGRDGDFIPSEEIYDALGVATERRNTAVCRATIWLRCARSSWRVPAGASPVRVRGSARPIASVAAWEVTTTAKRTQQSCGVWE